MALTERSHAALFRGLSDVIQNEEAVGEMLSFFPARDVEEPVTREFLRAEMADLRADMADLRAELKGDVADLRAEMHDGFRGSTRWTIGFMVTLSGVIIAANAAFH